MKSIKSFILLLAAVALVACEKADTAAKSDFSIAGYAQKGQFIKGAAVTAYALSDNLSATGESFPGTVRDDLGSFAVSAEISAPYLELRAEGYYFVENTGRTSAAPIYLNALAESSQTAVNINLLTTVTSGRIRHLIREGLSFDAAKRRAEKEFLDILSFRAGEIKVGFEEMNISQDGNANALLLAFSCLIQEDRSAGEVQKIISDIASEFEASGKVSEALLKDIFDESRQVSIPRVVCNLIEHYDRNGVSDFKIPPFYAMLDSEYAAGFHIVADEFYILPGSGYDTGTEGGVKEFYAISYEDFSTSSDVDWIAAEVTEICTNLYLLRINIAASSEVSVRTGHLYVKSGTGEILYTNTTRQKGSGQRIYIEEQSYSPRTRGFSDGDMINVNGQDYALRFDPYVNLYYVELPSAEGGYGISNRPDMVVAGKNGDVLCATFTFAPEVDEFLRESDNASIEFGGTRSDGTALPAAQDTPLYAALKALPGYDLPNPASVRLTTACALLTLEFIGAEPPEFARLDVELGPEGFLSGEATVCMYPDQAVLTPDYTVPEPEYRNKSNRVSVRNTDGDNRVSLLVLPQTVSSIKCTAFASDGSVLFETGGTLSGDLRKGSNIIYRFSIGHTVE